MEVSTTKTERNLSQQARRVRCSFLSVFFLVWIPQSTQKHCTDFRNDSECGTNKSREPRNGSRAICLFRTPSHFPWTQKKTLIPHIYNASNKDSNALTFLSTL